MTGPSALAGLYKVSWRGHIGSNEEFVYSRWATCASSFVQEDLADEFTGDVTDMLATTVTAGDVIRLEFAFPDYVGWDEVKVSPWDLATNKLIVGETPAYRTLTDTGAGSASGGLPDQCALAMTTRSARAGRRKYNRFYLPPLIGLATEGHGLVDVPVADAFVLWLHLNITARAAGTPAIHMVNFNFGLTPGPVSIEDIYLGRRLDVIRRRANKEPEPRVVDAL